MKITLYSIKGSAGKTPISTNIALDLGYCVGTNEGIDCYSHILSDEQFVRVGQNEEFPKFTDDTDVVFDLSGSIGDKALSITSAIKQSNVVIVPIYNHTRSLQGGITTILEVSQFTKNIIVVATKLRKSKDNTDKKKEGKLAIGEYDWTQCEDFLNIEKQVKDNIDFEIPIMPLKLSNAFDVVDDEEKSILQLVETNNLYKHFYHTEAEQMRNIYNLIKTYE
jgi:MinD-like ATPase involved in chromosome partitioning or flagellar assembly